MTLETRAENEARLRPWPEQLMPENVASWLWSNHGLPNDALPILQAMIDAHVLPVARQVKSLQKATYL